MLTTPAPKKGASAGSAGKSTTPYNLRTRDATQGSSGTVNISKEWSTLLPYNSSKTSSSSATVYQDVRNTFNFSLYRKQLSTETLNVLTERIDPMLIKQMEKKGWSVVLAKEGSEEFKYLTFVNADASINSAIPKHMIIKETATKSALLEEYLHGTQLKLGLLEKYVSEQALEVHVKDFMLRHVKMLGLNNPDDIRLLQELKVDEISRLNRLNRM